ncbi:hypothetical protein AJ79_03042 [Helicocarpus griseus UAMH5409]|uniref:FAD-binding FR-type domain-containing protein n=1 Tax=Helicocarpus griseus UAMH5409 TaxID=1447875 RepID=A0A2B7XZF4_9EURO|nr:hypothetical protein AJ79_03042 [Helicocarpus griseus UAMH5409]
MSLLLPLRPPLPCRSAAKRIRLSPIPPPRRHASTNTPLPPKHQRTYLRLTLATLTAAALGFYVRSHSSSSTSSTALNPSTFTAYELVSKTPVSSTSSIFTLRPVTAADSNAAVYKQAWQRGLWSVQFKQPQLQIGRDYTPLPPVSQAEEEEDGALRFLIRKDPYGEVSGYLHNLALGARVDIRGPRLDYVLPADVEEVLFIAGGTGIAPGLQAAYNMFSNGNEGSKRMHVLWANRRREDCSGGVSDRPGLTGASSGPWWRRVFGGGKDVSGEVDATGNVAEKGLMVRQLEELKAQYPGMFTVDYFVDEEGTLVGKGSILGFTKLREGKHGQGGGHGSKRRKLILISGPDGFISYLAGPKMWSSEGKEVQGPLQGLLRQLDLKGWSVWKL